MKKRKKQGGTLPLVIVTIFVIVILGVGFFFLAQLLGGERELQNSVDAGNLNVAKEALIKPTDGLNTISADAETQFGGLGPNPAVNTIDLNTYNRTSAITALVLSNARDMINTGTDIPGTTVQNATAVYNAWRGVSNQLANKLSDPSRFANDYRTIANSNSVKMLTGNANVNTSVKRDHTVAYSDKSALNSTDTSSNVGFLANGAGFAAQFPAAPNNQLFVDLSLAGRTNKYAKGYLSFNFGVPGTGSVFFVPLKQSGSPQRFLQSQPHRISLKTFQQDQQAGVPGWPTPVPNSFFSRAEAQAQQTAAQATLNSCAISQSLSPPVGYRAQIPRGFIRITNAGCSTPNPAIAPTGQDLFSFLMSTNLFFGKPDSGNLTVHLTTDPAILDRIAAANTSGQTPSNSDCQALKPPANSSDCGRITHKSPPITNLTPLDTAMKNYIAAQYNLAIPPLGNPTPVAGCLHAAEQANANMLSQRAGGGNATVFYQNNAFTSGIANVIPGRGAFGNCTNFQGAMTSVIHMSDLVPNTSNLIRPALVQRLQQIDPDFNGNLNTITGWTTVPVGLGDTLFIFFNGSVNPRTGLISGNLEVANANAGSIPNFFTAGVRNQQVDGKPAFSRTRITPVSNGGGINHAGDCGYPNPYDFYNGGGLMCVKDQINFIKCTGFRGLLGEIRGKTCYGNNGCAAIDVEQVGPANADCAGSSQSDWSGPC